MKCELGVDKPCTFTAKRRCPHCKLPSCPGHSKSLSTMNGDLSNGMKHRCSGCGVVSHRDAWLAIEVTA